MLPLPKGSPAKELEEHVNCFFEAGWQPKSLTSTLQVLPDLVLQLKRGQGTIPDLQRHSEAGPLCILDLWWAPNTQKHSILQEHLSQGSCYTNLMGNWGKAAAGLAHLSAWGFKKKIIMCLESNKIKCKKHLTLCRVTLISQVTFCQQMPRTTKSQPPKVHTFAFK